MYMSDQKPHELPAMHAVIKHATLPAIIARTTTLVISFFRLGARAPRAPSMMPIELIFENPQRAYVATTTDLSCNEEMCL
jgi:hypothetical protein